MHLQRIQVPDFRVLKDVEITFEKEFVPRIFPLGSLNGGGKSTLLQLIFVLLHCSTDSDRTIFLKNMLNGFKIYENADKRVIAIVDVWDGEKSVTLEFFAYKDSYARNLLNEADDEVSDEADDEVSDEADDEVNDDYLYFSILEETQEIYQKFVNKALEVVEIKRNFDKSKQEELMQAQSEFEELEEQYKIFKFHSEEIRQYLQSENLTYICSYSLNEDENEVLLCKTDNVDLNQAKSFLDELLQKVFLAAPATQVFLFLSKESRKLLFRDLSNDESDEINSYSSELKAANSNLPGFFAYDFLSVELLVESFKAAGDRDFREAIETGGYGNNYKGLMNDLKAILSNKKNNLNPGFSGVNFKLDRDGENIELLPEDLSHGELKRLSIYMWIKYHSMENAIILMDEVEIAFHPDWQYQIISDLKQWAPNNQYILATHSYELCQALTPSHVKELEPKLLKKEVKQ
jgi:predicted ATP-binding protein involved in virulence